MLNWISASSDIIHLFSWSPWPWKADRIKGRTLQCKKLWSLTKGSAIPKGPAWFHFEYYFKHFYMLKWQVKCSVATEQGSANKKADGRKSKRCIKETVKSYFCWGHLQLFSEFWDAAEPQAATTLTNQEEKKKKTHFSGFLSIKISPCSFKQREGNTNIHIDLDFLAQFYTKSFPLFSGLLVFVKPKCIKQTSVIVQCGWDYQGCGAQQNNSATLSCEKHQRIHNHKKKKACTNQGIVPVHFRIK